MSPLRHLFLLFPLIPVITAAADPLPIERLRLPAGFTIELYASDVAGARSMVLGTKGTLFVGSRHAGRVYAVTDRNRDGIAESVRVIARGLELPNGVAFRNDALYVAEVGRVLRFDDIERRLSNPPSPVVVYQGLPKARHHGWRYIGFGPDDKLYVSVGAPCNVCDTPGYGHILRMDPDGKEVEIVARGVRNSVGFDWHPGSGIFWFTDNGRDWLGDDLPPDELNRVAEPGLHFGFPYCHGGTLLDPEFGKGKDCRDFVPPAQALGPHVASLGMRFYDGAMFPAEYRGQIFIAEHGSWNRSTKIGYRITLVRLDGERPVSYESFAEGWLSGESSWGRPVDLLLMPDGAMLVSDDQAGVIYRIYYTAERKK